LNVGNINIPPLRERKEDIPVLAYAFLNEFAQKFDKKIKRIEPSALELLQDYYWKGNIRELRNVMERVTLLLEEDELKDRHFQFLIPQGQTTAKQGDEFILKVPSKGIKIELVLRKLIEDTGIEKILSSNDYRGIALVYTALGEKETAFAWLEKSYQKHEESLCSMGIDPKFDSIRDDPRFKEIMKKIGLA